MTVYKAAEAVDQAAARTPIDRLLLVVHGIGQNLQGRCLTAAVPRHLACKGSGDVLLLCALHSSSEEHRAAVIRPPSVPGSRVCLAPHVLTAWYTKHCCNVRDWQCPAGGGVPDVVSLYAPVYCVLYQSPSTALRSNIGDDAANVRAALAAAAVSEAGSGDSVTSRTEVLPVQWRKHLTLDVRRPALVPVADQSATCVQGSACVRVTEHAEKASTVMCRHVHAPNCRQQSGYQTRDCDSSTVFGSLQWRFGRCPGVPLTAACKAAGAP